ncbi:hypothetical protein E2C01_053924 [Portunus trituberculatus]|uniref:Uncharacterized protein n=1 Tax=Portunus trituberculatus TaxID=210409 RepID=A0A5B7GRC9_PORTR|nr:hypothetical protein [Portunus trituberculatus]
MLNSALMSLEDGARREGQSGARGDTPSPRSHRRQLARQVEERVGVEGRGVMSSLLTRRRSRSSILRGGYWRVVRGDGQGGEVSRAVGMGGDGRGMSGDGEHAGSDREGMSWVTRGERGG